MKTKPAITLVLTVACLFPIVTGVSTAQQSDPHKASLDYTVYLPIVSQRSRYTMKPSVYIVVSDPVVRVGQVVTATGAIVNECDGPVGKPWFQLTSDPTGILSVTSPTSELMLGVPPWGYVEDQITMLATAPGAVTMTMWVRYETHDPGIDPPIFYYAWVKSSPTAIRVLP